MSERIHSVLIADDEMLSRQYVRELIKEDPRFQVVAVCESGRATISEAKRFQLDAVFLDIHMPGMDGFEVADLLRGNQRPLIVFVTAHGDYAVRAFEQEAFDYIKKPIDPARFDRVLDRLQQRLVEMESVNFQSSKVISSNDTQTISASEIQLDKKLLNAVRQDLVYRESEIRFIESAGNYVNVHINEESYLVREALEKFCQRLSSPDFVRVHRSFVVNVRRVSKMRYGKSGSAELELSDGHIVPVSRGRRKEVADILRRLIDSTNIQDEGYVI